MFLTLQLKAVWVKIVPAVVAEQVAVPADSARRRRASNYEVLKAGALSARMPEYFAKLARFCSCLLPQRLMFQLLQSIMRRCLPDCKFIDLLYCVLTRTASGDNTAKVLLRNAVGEHYRYPSFSPCNIRDDAHAIKAFLAI